MFNGVESFENHVDGDDERSEDGISSYQERTQEQEATSDLEQSGSDTGGNIEVPENQDGDGMSEEAEIDNTDVLGGFFRLLPYLYLVQRSLGTSPSAMMADHPGEDGANFSEAGTNQLYESQRLKSLLHLESLKNQFQTSSLRYVFNNLQQCMPLASVNDNDMSDPANTANGSVDGLLEPSSKYEEPLDLTKKNKRVKVETKTKDDKIMRPSPRGERGYTIQDLEAALQDIKSGKLGTRRAAVIYGIPRSTLRNKVYKMGKCQSKSPPTHQQSRSGIQNRMGDKNGNTSKSVYPGTNVLSEADRDQCEVNEEDVEISTHTGKFLKFRNRFHEGSENLMRVENSSSNEAPSSQIEAHSSFADGSSKAFISMGAEGHIRRGRHSSSSSLPLHNFPCVQSPGTSYDGLYGDSSAGKKSRPKRGKYRNYDRDALAKAVQAVQNGEMSVHRAGSFFGVPHSTLEYKVKERHLLRQAKFKGNKSATNSANKSSQPTAGCSSITSLSPTALADSNDSSHFPKVVPDLQLSLSQYLTTNKNVVGSKFSSAADLLGLGFRNAEKDESKLFESFVRSRKTLDEPLSNVYDSNAPDDLLDLTKKS